MANDERSTVVAIDLLSVGAAAAVVVVSDPPVVVVSDPPVVVVSDPPVVVVSGPSVVVVVDGMVGGTVTSLLPQSPM